MTTTSDGSLYVVTASVGSVALGSPGFPLIGVFNTNLQMTSGVRGSTAESFRDVVLDPTGRTGYWSSSLHKVYAFNVTTGNASPKANGPEPTEGIIALEAFDDAVEERSAFVESSSFVPTLAPNPFQDRITLRFHLDQPSEGNVTLLGMDGRTALSLSTQQFDAGEQTLSFDLPKDLPAGVYWVRVQLADGTTFGVRGVR